MSRSPLSFVLMTSIFLCSIQSIFAQRHKDQVLVESINLVKDVLITYEGRYEDALKTIPDGWEVIDHHRAGRIIRCRPLGEARLETIETILSAGNIQHLEPNFEIKVEPRDERLVPEAALAIHRHRILQCECRPNDPYLPSQWGLENTHAPKAWGCRKTSAYTVAVIDTGVDYHHPDLSRNMWKNPREIPGDNVDNDGNGYVDDVYGYDFRNNDADPFDDHRHGTHCAGIIGAVGNNGIGVSGIVWRVKIMSVKFLGSNGTGSVFGAIQAIDYARENGAKILSNSWGSQSYSPALAAAVSRCRDDGVLFVAAAGNRNRDNDHPYTFPEQPASLPHTNIISVASIDLDNRRSSFSSYGRYTVDIAAPGRSILSTLPNGRYGYLSGTSMATPHVSGAAALVWSHYACCNWQSVKDRLIRNARPESALKNLVLAQGTLDLTFLCRCDCYGSCQSSCCNRRDYTPRCRPRFRILRGRRLRR